MNLTTPYGRRDQPADLAGDLYFVGVDERLSPHQLPPGYGARATNLRFRLGKPVPRGGSKICPWLKEDGLTPWDEVYGGIVWSDPNQTSDWFVIAADGGVWKTRPHMTATEVPLPAGVSLTADTFKMFVPVTDGGVGVLVLLRGDDTAPLVCTDLDTGFTAVPAHSGGTRDMPNSRFGINWLNRLLLLEDKDTVAASDILAYNDFVAIQNEYRLNTGESQPLVRIQPMPGKVLLGFKTQSVLQVTEVQNNEDGTLNGVGPDTVTDRYGLCGPLACVRSGANCYWITGEPSINNLQLTALNQAQDTQLSLSRGLKQTFGRINSGALSGAALEIWDGKLYCALPLDAASGTDLDAWPAPTGVTLTLDATSGTQPFNQGVYYRVRVWGMATLNGTTYFSPGYGESALVSDASSADLGRLKFTFDPGPYTAFRLQLFYCDSDGNVTSTRVNGTTYPCTASPFYYTGPIPDWDPSYDETYRPLPPGVRRTTNTAIAVYDFEAPVSPAQSTQPETPGAWCGVDEADGVFAVKTFLKTEYHGRIRLFLLTTDGLIRLYEEGDCDEVLNADGEIERQEIETSFTSRAYACTDGDRTRFLACTAKLLAHHPSYTLSTVRLDMGNAETQQAAVTRSATVYDRHGTTDWDSTNANDDWASPGRQDYAVTFGHGFNLGSGVCLGQKQYFTDRLPLAETADYVQVQLANTQGQLELLGLKMEAEPAERPSGVSAT